MENNNENVTAFEVFNNTEDLAASMDQQQSNEPVVEQQVAETTPSEPETQQPIQESQPESQSYEEPVIQQEYSSTTQSQPSYSDQDLDGEIMRYMSQKLGREINSFDDFNVQETKAVDERIEAISRFVQDTGRSPEDWFRFQSLNPEGMDDLTAIRVQTSNEYPNLSYDELNLLVDSKYKLDEDLYSEEEVKLSRLQLKIDGDKARRGIEDIRKGYAAPEIQNSEPESIIDDQWISNMSQEVDAITGLEFDLGNNKSFEFGLDDDYKNHLKSRQARLDEFFDSYVREDGSWDYDTLSSHMAVIDNVDRIVKAAYTRGLGDGQRTLVNTASNVSTKTPQQGNQNQQTNPLAEQLKTIMTGSSGKMTFNI